MTNNKNALDRYQEAAGRTAPGPITISPEMAELANYGLGIGGEAGEVVELIKKAVYHGHKIDQEDIKKELGDVVWYVVNIARLAGINFSEVAAANIEKLKARYPEGFSTEASQNRTE